MDTAPTAASTGTPARDRSTPRPRAEPAQGASGAQAFDRRSLPDQLARQLLRLEGTAPRSLIPLRGSLFVSAVRCVISYAILPVLAPLVGVSGMVARPVSIALSTAAAVLAVVSLRRVWAADWSYRWTYTGFSIVILTLLAIVILIDVRALMTASR